jgi:hypothetical protein
MGLALDCPSLEIGPNAGNDLSALLGPEQRLPFLDEIAPCLDPLINPISTSPGFDRTWRLSQACGPAPMMKKLPNTGSRAHQPGKDASLAKLMPAIINSISVAADHSRHRRADKAESSGRTAWRFGRSLQANSAPAMNSQNRVNGRKNVKDAWSRTTAMFNANDAMPISTKDHVMAR